MIFYWFFSLRIGFEVTSLNKLKHIKKQQLLDYIKDTLNDFITQILSFRWQKSAAWFNAFKTDAYASSKPVYLPTKAMITSSNCLSDLWVRHKWIHYALWPTISFKVNKCRRNIFFIVFMHDGLEDAWEKKEEKGQRNVVFLLLVILFWVKDTSRFFFLHKYHRFIFSLTIDRTFSP